MLANDEDVDGDPLAVTILTGPVSGTLTPPDAPGGSWTYTPDADFFGDDSFTYSISDALNPPAILTVSITVPPVNHAPVLAPVADRRSAQGDQIVTAHVRTPVNNAELVSLLRLSHKLKCYENTN